MATEERTSLLRPLVEDLHARREKAKLGGGPERIARQHDQGRLTARERIDLLVDEGTFTELGVHAGIHFSVRGFLSRYTCTIQRRFRSDILFSVAPSKLHIFDPETGERLTA